MKKTTLIVLLIVCLTCTGCLGPNNALNSLNNWNGSATEQDWLNEVIFLGMVIVPVYEFALLGDYLIFNTWDYWGGDNPISDPGSFPASFGGGD